LHPDAIVLATGGTPARVNSPYIDGSRVLTAQEVLAGKAEARGRVVIADTMGDWVATGLALQLARGGNHVSLYMTGAQAGEAVPSFVRDEGCAQLFNAGVDVVPFMRLFGLEDATVYFEHILALKPVEVEGVDALITSFGAEADRKLEFELEGLGIDLHIIGDCLTPRTAEEAVLDALKVASKL